MTQNTRNMPWIDARLTVETMEYLWERIDTTTTITQQQQSTLDAKKELAGNISKSVFLEDKDNSGRYPNDWFYENALKKLTEVLYYRDSWSNYHDEHIGKITLPAEFKLTHLWVNYQKQYEFNPPHDHNGGIGFSFVVFMEIPTNWKEQHALPFSANSTVPCASDFQFILPHQPRTEPKVYNIPLSAEDEGKMLFFYSWLTHQVFPFYGTEEERITVSGNIEQIIYSGSGSER